MFFKNKIVVGITTTPIRIKYIIPTLKSLLTQSKKPDKIILSLTYEIARTGEKIEKIPYELLKYIKNKPVEIIIVPDYGPATKFVGLLLTVKNPKTYLIWVDDDIIYNKNAIKILVKCVSKVKHSLACSSLLQVTSSRYTHIKDSSYIYKNNFYIAESYAGVCCRLCDMPPISAFPYYTRDEYEQLSENEKRKFNCCDFMISYHLYKNDINYLLVNQSTYDNIRDISMDVDALHSIQKYSFIYKDLYIDIMNKK